MSATVTSAGLYEMTEADYFADPVPGGSLSCSEAKKLLGDGGPAKYRWQREHPEPPTEAMELGSAAHTLVLGTGSPLVEVKADSWRGKAANEAADAARAEGSIPLLTKDIRVVHDMATALMSHPTAGPLLRGDRGDAELSAFWDDPEHGIWRRCRFDFLPDWKPIVADYKTCRDASKAGFAKAVAEFRYHMQAEWYCDGFEAVYDMRPAFLFVAQEKTPPYLVGVYDIDVEAAAIAREANAKAMRTWRECREAGTWPGYSAEIETVTLPRWAAAREDYL